MNICLPITVALIHIDVSGPDQVSQLRRCTHLGKVTVTLVRPGNCTVQCTVHKLTGGLIALEFLISPAPPFPRLKADPGGGGYLPEEGRRVSTTEIITEGRQSVSI